MINKNQCPGMRDSRLAAKSLLLGVYDPKVKLFTSLEPYLYVFFRSSFSADAAKHHIKIIKQMYKA